MSVIEPCNSQFMISLLESYLEIKRHFQILEDYNFATKAFFIYEVTLLQTLITKIRTGFKDFRAQ